MSRVDQARPSIDSHVSGSGLEAHGCPQTEIALRHARARRPRKTDCDPLTDFNLCANEREYSIEAARCFER
jgi:hypothetical protein